MRLSVKSVGDGADYRVRHFRLSRRTKMSEIEKNVFKTELALINILSRTKLIRVYHGINKILLIS